LGITFLGSHASLRAEGFITDLQLLTLAFIGWFLNIKHSARRGFW
jgi:hypothetical protein